TCALPIWIVSETSTAVISIISSLSRPEYPFKIPFILIPRLKPLLTTARIAAFIPGASPPLVKTPIVLISLFAVIFLLHILAALCFYIYTLNRSYFIAFSRSEERRVGEEYTFA